jgi:hypothetical protein
MFPEEARRRALVKPGGVALTKELHREQGGLPMLETLIQDLRFGARTLIISGSTCARARRQRFSKMTRDLSGCCLMTSCNRVWPCCGSRVRATNSRSDHDLTITRKSSMIIISDTGPLHYLILIDETELLKEGSCDIRQ